MKTISRAELQQMMAPGGLQIIEVLGPEKYRRGHIPGAINVPLDHDFEQHVEELVPDHDQQVVLYCCNERCPKSGDAARAMERLGYTNVFHYAAGKDDWEDAGLRTEAA